ncbi:YdcF family protein [Rhodococcus sp. NPDC058521]|uniref:YdcF family protein n=1 Tax=Rhodococcus sp. NPDC058521 TaxID=3346536 RepID=UPI003660AE18
MHARTRGRIRRRVLVALVLVAAGLVMAAGWPVYVRPHVDPPEQADAIFVLGGDDAQRRESLALQLAEDGFAPRVVFSDPYRGDKHLERICRGTYAFEVSCFRPDPVTTRGEARELRDLARAEGWDRVIVVTYDPHVSRARDIVEECWSGEVLMVSSGSVSVAATAWNYMYQSAGYVRSVFQGC